MHGLRQVPPGGQPFEARGEPEAGVTGFGGAAGLELFGAVGDPEEVVEFLGVAGVGVIGAFVFVFDVGAGGLHAFACFPRSVARATVDGAAGGFGEGGGCEGKWKCEQESC